MQRSSLGMLADRMRETIERAGQELTDGDLLRRWTSQHDQAAFELLVWRHGRLVWSVCRRLLRDVRDAEDAFQATFLVLVRKARSISREQAVAAWLHTVATRIALQAREEAGRRPVQGLAVEPVDRSGPTGPDPELAAVLDQEVSRLPVKYREPFVLCCLQGKTNEEAARHLGRPVGTILSQLSRARERLRQRLSRRGLAPTVLPVVMEVGSALPASLPAATTAAVSSLMAGSGPPTAAVGMLMKGALHAMFMSKCKAIIVAMVATVILGTGGLIGFQQATGQSSGHPAGGQPPTRTQKEQAELAEAAALYKQVIARQQATEAARKDMDAAILALSGRFGTVEALKAAQKISKEDLAILEAEVARVKAQIVATEAMHIEAARRLQAAERLRDAVKGGVSNEDLAVLRATADKYKAEVRVLEARLRIEDLLVAKAKRALADTQPKPAPQRTAEERLTELERQVKALQKEIHDLRKASGPKP